MKIFSFSLMAVIALALGLSSSSVSAGTIAEWDFESDAVAINNNPVADIGSGTADSIGMNIYPTPNVGVTTDDVLDGATGDTGTNGNANLTQIWRVRAQAGANGAANGWSSSAPIGTQGAQFAAPIPAGVTSVNVQFDWYATNQGEANMQLEYSLSGSAGPWQNVALNPIPANDTPLVLLTNSGSDANTVTGSYVSGGVGGLGQNWFTGLSATINDPGLNNDPNFMVEMVNASTGVDCISVKGTALNNSSGNWRFDNVSISTVPEPSTFALLGVGAVGLLGYARRRRAI